MIDPNKAVAVRVTEHIYSDDVWVLIPPRYWNKPALLEGLLKIIRKSLEDAHVSKSNPVCKPD